MIMALEAGKGGGYSTKMNNINNLYYLLISSVILSNFCNTPCLEQISKKDQFGIFIFE